MGRRTPIPVDLPPGVVKRSGLLQATGRWIDTDKVRFVNKRAQKMGGFIRHSSEQLDGVPRGAHSWNSLAGKTYLSVGTTRRLYLLDEGTPTNITPIDGAPVTLTSAFSTTNGQANIIVHHTAHAKGIGRTVTFSDLSGLIGGLDLEGAEFTITAVVGSNSYVITSPIPATSTTTTAGSADATYDISLFTQNPAGGFGYGTGTYGTGTYGTPREATAILFDAGYWSIENFGQILLASNFEGGLYSYDPTGAELRALPVPNAPGAMRGFFVTSERFVVCYGASIDEEANIDPMLLRWCSQGNYELWDPDTTNSANSRRLTEGRKLMGGGPMGANVALVWSDSALYTMQYTGSKFVYATTLAGVNCGLVGPTAFAFTRGRAFWFGSKSFLTYSGGSVDRIPNCNDIAEWVLDQIRPFYETKTLCFYNERYDEIWWLFVPTGEEEPAFYVAVNLSDWSWINGTMRRTSATKLNGSNPNPILTDPDGWVYEHETGRNIVDAAGDPQPMAAHIQSAPFQAQEGAMLTHILGYAPDFAAHNGTVTLTVTARDRAPTEILGTETVELEPGTGLEDFRIRGRLLDIRLESDVLDGDFVLGSPSFEMMVAGRRR